MTPGIWNVFLNMANWIMCAVIELLSMYFQTFISKLVNFLARFFPAIYKLDLRKTDCLKIFKNKNRFCSVVIDSGAKRFKSFGKESYLDFDSYSLS